jgi:Tfp pilus assembly protein PilE
MAPTTLLLNIQFGRVRMTQSNLLELARKGHPQAIATLMNAVLEPKGVTAKTQLNGSCLHIVFTSEHLLSQAAIGSFVKNGLATLGAKSFQSVKVYFRKRGEDSPLWVDSFILGQPSVAQTSPPTVPAPAPVQPSAQLPQLTPPAAVPVASPETPVGFQRQPSPPTQAPSGLTPAQRLRHVFSGGNGWKNQWIGVANRYKVAIAVSVGAFLIGGTAAFLTNTQAESTPQASTPQTTASLPPKTEQSIVPPRTVALNTPEGQAEAYLIQMNQAQQKFYQANGRFAATLEELERSAAIMSQSAYYTYRLVLRGEAQSVLTAVPKQEGLKSYSGTVLTATAPTGTRALASIVCQTNQPSSFPPILAQAPEPPILCPPDATPVAN